MIDDPNAAASRLAQLAAGLDCLTEADLMLLTDTTEKTIESWRKRGNGPAVALVGNRYLYPRAAVAQWLQSRIRERRATPIGDVL